MRDYTGLCAVFIALYGAAGIVTIPSMRVSLTYLLVLAAQFVLVRQAACNYGNRFVTTVLACKTGKEVPAAKAPKATKPRARKPRADAANDAGA
jgi:hypothetical protein